MKCIASFVFAYLILVACASNVSAIIRTVGLYQSIDIPVSHSEQGIKNVWEDVSVVAEFTAPNVQSSSVRHGFYHSANLWIVRIAPDQEGVWRYKITTLDRGMTSTLQDSFQCVTSQEQGFIRLDSLYHKRLIYSSTGKLFNALGFGDCMQAQRDSIFEYGYIDGGFRTAGINGTTDWALPYEQYLTAYGDVAGFNLYRYSDGNCAYSIVRSIGASGNIYDTLYSRWTDTLFYALRRHGFRIYMTILSGPVGSSSDAQSMAAVYRYAQYCIDRFGSLVDFWELANESSPDSLWISEVAGYIHTHDPYHHLVSMSWQQPNHPAIDIISPHWYGKEDVRNSDQATADEINQYRDIQKPVLFGEQGEGATWDSLSSTRMRGRIWSALFNSGTIIFWNTSFAKDCPCNEYLGWEERRNARVLNNFSNALLPDLIQTTPRTSGSCKVWGLYSASYIQSAYYIRNDQDVNAINTNISVLLGEVAKGGEAIWYDVHTGDILQRIPITPSLQSVIAPPFKTDIALIAGIFQDSLRDDTLFRLNVTPRTITMLDVPAKSRVTRVIGLKNTGQTPVTIQGARFSGSSTNLTYAPSFPLTLAPTDSESLSLSFDPADSGVQLAMLSLLRSDSPAWENVAITLSSTSKASVPNDQTMPSDLLIRPDPASQYIIVDHASNLGQSATIKLYSEAGECVLTTPIGSGGKIDIHSLPSGVYSLQVFSGSKLVQRSKVVVFR